MCVRRAARHRAAAIGGILCAVCCIVIRLLPAVRSLSCFALGNRRTALGAALADGSHSARSLLLSLAQAGAARLGLAADGRRAVRLTQINTRVAARFYLARFGPIIRHT